MERTQPSTELPSSAPHDVLLAGRYRYVADIARGSTGRVIHVRDEAGGKSWVAKAVSPQDAPRLAAEMDALVDVCHVSMVRPRELLRVERPLPPPFALRAGSAVLIEEHLDGDTLANTRCGTWADVARAGAQLAAALSELHRVNLVHGDVSPHNVIALASRWVLVDLGHVGAPGYAGGVAGTLGFMAPEAFSGMRTPATDLYALGATLLATAPGAVPLPLPSGLADAHEHAQRLQQLARERLREAPSPLSELITALVAPSQTVRPNDAQEVAARFAWEHEESQDAPGTEELAPLRMRARRNAPRLAGALRSARFVGHEEALDGALRTVRERATGALPATLVWISGPPGSGRERFAQELAQRLQRTAFDGGLPVPTLTRTPALPAPPEHPAVVEWVAPDADATRALRFLDASELERSPCVVVAVRREDAPRNGQATEPAAADARVIEVQLGPVSPAAVRALLSDALREDPTPAELDAALALTGGLVGALVELLATRTLEGSFLRARDLLAVRGPSAEWSPPPLPIATMELLEQASVCRDGLPLPVDDGVPEGLSSTLTLGLLSTDRAGHVVPRADVREAVLAQLTAARRARIAKGLLPRIEAPLVRAHVAAEAGDTALAESELRRALRSSGTDTPEVTPERVSGVAARLPTASPETRREVAAWLRRAAATELALAALEGLEDVESLALRAEVLRQQGDQEGAATALELASRDPAAKTSEAYLRSAGRLALERGGAGALLEAFAQHSPDAPHDSPAFLEVRALDRWAHADLERADRDAELATTLALRRDRPGDAARCASVRATIAQRRGDAASAYALGRSALELAERAGEKLAAAVYGLNLGLACFELGRLGEALTRVRTGAERLAELGRDDLLAQATLNLAHVHLAFGDDGAAAELLPLATRKAESASLPSVLAHADLTRASIALRRGKLQPCAAYVDAALDRASACGPAALPLLLARAALCLAEGAEPVRALSLLSDERLRGALDDADASLTLRLARGTLALRGDAAARRDAVEQLAPAAADPRGWERQLQASLLTSELLERLGDTPGALSEARRARGLLDSALDSLPNTLRPVLLETPRYQRALRVAPLVDRSAMTALGGHDAFRELPLHVQRFISAGTPGRLLQRIADAAQALTRAGRGFVVERDNEGGWLTLASTDDASGPARGFSRSVAGRALASGRSVSAIDAVEDAQLNTSGSVISIGTRSVLAAPLVCPGRQLVLYVDDRTRPAAFDQESEEVFVACAELGALALTASWDAAALKQERQKLAAAEAALRTDVDAQQEEITALRRAVMSTEHGGMVAGPGPMRRTLELAQRAAASAVPVLILGESGTGKELVARFLHDQSARRDKRFVSENCAAIPETLLESALFGHERGAFTGADRARQGLFHAADGGTLFLDEIGEMSPAMQAKLLRVLQNGEVRSVGGSRVSRVDVRLVTATHRDLRAMVTAGEFREDLYYRITVVTLELPPLRERPDDIPLLVRHFLRKHREGAPPRIVPEAMQRLVRAPWPGNVRQLENEVQRLLVMAGDPIEARDVVLHGPSSATDSFAAGDTEGSLALRDHVDALERRLITAALARTDNNQTRAALELGVSRYGLQKMMKRLGLRD